MKRREFIILTGAGATSSTLLSACGHPENKLIRALIPDEEYVPGTDYWKASTCAMCDAGCGIVVRTREHNANKIEGNPLHPVNRGSLCARGQAGLQVLYNPDRIKGPMKRAGERGSGQFEEISWDEAIKLLANKLREIKSQGRAGQVVFATGERDGVTGLVAEHFMQAYGARMLTAIDRQSESSASDSYAESYGPGRPTFDIANASYLLSFGARFLETWHSPVMYSLAYGEFRRAKNRARGKFVQVEPRMSLTAANADEWLPAAVGTEGLVALALTQVITREGLIKAPQAPAFIREPLDGYAPEQTSERTGIEPDKIVRIAREMAASERPLVIAGGAAGAADTAADNLKAINFLNVLLGNLNKTGGVLLSNNAGFDPLEKLRNKNSAVWMRGWENAVSAPASALLIHSANPVYSKPWTRERIKAAEFITSFSPFLDETAQLADLILPDNSYLERWDIKRIRSAGQNAVTITRPVVKQVVASKQTADTLLAVSREMGASLPFDSSEDVVKQLATQLSKEPGSIKNEGPDEFLKSLLDRGVWVSVSEPKSRGENGSAEGRTAGRSQTAPAADKAVHARSEPGVEYPLTLLAYEHAALGMGDQANLPSLQELPDPMTSVMWGSWVEINPKTAASLGIADGDLVEIASQHGAVRAPAVVYPAIRPDVVAMPCGQGHSGYGRYAATRGVSPAELSPPSSRVEPLAIGVRISKVSSEGKLIRFGTDVWEKIEKKR